MSNSNRTDLETFFVCTIKGLFVQNVSAVIQQCGQDRFGIPNLRLLTWMEIKHFYQIQNSRNNFLNQKLWLKLGVPLAALLKSTQTELTAVGLNHKYQVILEGDSPGFNCTMFLLWSNLSFWQVWRIWCIDIALRDPQYKKYFISKWFLYGPPA